MVVASCVEGRMRIRDERLKGDLAEEVRSALLSLPDVVEVTVNKRVGSLLILYGEAATACRAILDFLSGIFGSPDNPAAEGVRKIKEAVSRIRALLLRKCALNLGMLLSLAASLLAAVLDAEMLHIVAGGIFLAVVGYHIYEKRRALLPVR